MVIEFAEILQDLELKRAAALPSLPRSRCRRWTRPTCACSARTAVSRR